MCHGSVIASLRIRSWKKSSGSKIPQGDRDTLSAWRLNDNNILSTYSLNPLPVTNFFGDIPWWNILLQPNKNY